jgi:hypothetical protein
MASVAFSSSPALAERCVPARIEIAGAPPPRWRAAIERLARDVQDDPEIDCSGIAIAITATPERAQLEATALDGRRARRTASIPGELGAVALGLMASIPADASPPPGGPTDRNEPPSSGGPSDDRNRSDRGEFAAPIPTHVVEMPERFTSPFASAPTLGFTFGTRLGLPTGVLSTEVELRGDMRLGRWVVALSGRTAPFGSPLSGVDSEYTEVSFGALAGRWFSLGDGVLTLIAGPRIGTIIDETDSATTSRRDVWLQAAARYVAPLGERWRPAVGLELETAPTRIFASATSLAAFPSWSASMRFGVVGSIL